MSTAYTYSVATDFGGSLDSNLFLQEIEDDVTITVSVNALSVVSDVVTVVFAQALSGAQITQLSTLMGSHVPVISTGTRYVPVFSPPDKYFTNKTSFQQVTSMIFGGTAEDTSPISFEFIMDNDSTVSSYDIRVMDTFNVQTVLDSTFTTNTGCVNTGVISNLPTTKTVLSVQARRSGGNGNVVIRGFSRVF